MTMTTTLNAPANERPRRTLNETIGQLDQLIEGLSTAIPETIRDTLQEQVGAAVSAGVRTALVDLLSNPEVLALLRNALAPEPLMAVPVTPARPPLFPGVLGTLLGATRAAGQWAWQQLKRAGQAVAGWACQAAHQLVALRQQLQALRQVRKPLLLALAIGGLAAAVALLAPHWVAATLSGLGGLCVTLTVQLGLWLRRSLGGFVMTSS
jgi:hypothetical protein